MKIPVIRNTFTNYVKMIVFLLEGILTARWIIGFLGMESYGLWALLWSFFVYSILLDFGCGTAAQKYASGGLYEKDREAFSRVQSTIFTFHLAMAAVIAAATVGCSFFLPWLLKISDPEKLSEATVCFYLFGIGSALLFPTGIFPEILVGLQKLYLRNLVVVICKILELVGVITLFLCGGGLVALIAYVMFTTILANAVMGLCVFRQLPGFRLRIGWDSAEWRNILKFSGFVYLGILSNLILRRSSRILITIFCGLSDVGLFQLSTRIPDLCGQMVNQYQENISPVTGALFHRGKLRGLGRIVFGAMRWNAFAATGVTAAALLLTEPLLKFLFNVTDPTAATLSRWLLVSVYLSTVLRTVPHRYFQMSEQHRLANWILFGEAAANLILDVLLLKPFGVFAVVWVSIGVKAAVAAGFVLPFLLKRMYVTAGEFCYRIFLQPMLAAIPAVLWILGILHFSNWSACPTVLAGGAGAGVLYLGMMLHLCPLPRKLRMRFAFSWIPFRKAGK